MKKGKNKRYRQRNGPRLERLKSGARRVGRRVRARVTRPERPDWKTSIASLAGGAGGAALGGLVVNQELLSPEAVGLGMALGGAAVAYLSDGNTRVVANSVASAGAGQLALALMGRKAIGKVKPEAPLVATADRPAPAALPAPSAPPARKSATGGGAVIELFRDAAMDLEMLDDDEIRYGVRDADAGDYYEHDAYDYPA